MVRCNNVVDEKRCGASWSSKTALRRQRRKLKIVDGTCPACGGLLNSQQLKGHVLMPYRESRTLRVEEEDRSLNDALVDVYRASLAFKSRKTKEVTP